VVVRDCASLVWICRAVGPTVIGLVCLTTSTFAVGNDRALYVGGTLEQMAPPVVGRAESLVGALSGGVSPPPKIEGRIILTANGGIEFDAGRRGRVVIPYEAITSLEYGLESGRRMPKAERVHLVIRWDPTEQFTKNAHNLLTIAYRNESSDEAIVLELGKNLVRPTLESLERRTGKTVEFLNVEACMQLRSNADVCGYGRPGELRGLKKVYIEEGIPPEGRKIIRSEIENSKAGLEVVDALDGAEILLRFRSRRSLDPNCPCEGGRGEVLLAQGEQRRVVLVFTGMKKGIWGKNPTEDFGRTFVNAVRSANGLPQLRD
jgi:hypothetical protein